MTSSIDHIQSLSFRHILFVAPIILMHLGCGLALTVGVSKPALLVFFGSMTIQMFGITLGYHRLIAHKSFSTTRTLRFLLALFGVLAGQNGPVWWVSHHRHHHKHSDRVEDTHSPITKGLFWSHMGWLFSPQCVRSRVHLVADIVRIPELVFLQRYFYVANLSYALLLYGLGETLRLMLVETSTSGFQLVVWGAIISKVPVCHAVWSANSVCHRRGSRCYSTPDNSRNNVIVALVTFGDGWHHNHHYYPNSARHGFRWWEVDINFMVLKVLSAIGLVWGLRTPPQASSSLHADGLFSATASPHFSQCVRTERDGGGGVG